LDLDLYHFFESETKLCKSVGKKIGFLLLKNVCTARLKPSRTKLYCYCLFVNYDSETTTLEVRVGRRTRQPRFKTRGRVQQMQLRGRTREESEKRTHAGAWRN
jgi:hypothetical protein